MFEPVSARNALVGQLRRLSRRSAEREEQGCFLVEGLTLLDMALEVGTPVSVVAHDASSPLSDGLVESAERASRSGARLVELPPGVMARVADTANPPALAFVAKRNVTDLEDLVGKATSGLPVVVLIDVGDPGNAGTLLRSAEAAGVAGVVFCAGSVDPFHPKTVRASAGSIFVVPVVVGTQARMVLGALGEAGLHRVGTVVRGGVPLDAATLSGPVAIVMGNEAHGLPADLGEILDEVVTIPMNGRAESLNVAMAGTLMVFEAARRRVPGS